MASVFVHDAPIIRRNLDNYLTQRVNTNAKSFEVKGTSLEMAILFLGHANDMTIFKFGTQTAFRGEDTI